MARNLLLAAFRTGWPNKAHFRYLLSQEALGKTVSVKVSMDGCGMNVSMLMNGAI
jgi:hypothetical protein